MCCWDALIPYRDYFKIDSLLNKCDDLLDKWTKDYDDAHFDEIMEQVNYRTELYDLFYRFLGRFRDNIEDPEVAKFYDKYGKHIFERVVTIFQIREIYDSHARKTEKYEEDFDDYGFGVDWAPADIDIALQMYKDYRSLAYKANQINRVHETCIRNST